MVIFSEKKWQVLGFSPAKVTFFASLLLSVVALFGATLNRDGILYVDTAAAFLEGGFGAAKDTFNWPLLPILIAVISQFSGLGLEKSGHLLNAFFMAGTCTLLVDCVRQKDPRLAWWSCLIVLAMPGLNDNRDEIIREYGCWFFIVFAFWLALRWADSLRWSQAFLIQISLVLAAFFRPEAFAMFPALVFWQLSSAPRNQRWKRFVMLGAFPVLVFFSLLAAFWAEVLPRNSRLAGEFGRANIESFNAKVQVLATALTSYSKDETKHILFFGSLALVPIKIISKLGGFIIPLVFLFFIGQVREALRQHSLLACAIAAHLLVLAGFVLNLQFLATRYVAPVLLFCVPFIAHGLYLIDGHYPRWRGVLVSLMLLTALSNVNPFHNGKKAYFVEAGKWLAANVSDSPRVYIESNRTTYYAGWRTRQQSAENTEALVVLFKQGSYDLLIFEFSHNDVPVDALLEKSGLRVVKRFEARNKDAVIVAAPLVSERMRDSP